MKLEPLNLRERVPHIKIGLPDSPNQVSKPMFNEKEDKIISLVKKVGFVLAISLVVIYAVWRIFA